MILWQWLRFAGDVPFAVAALLMAYDKLFPEVQEMTSKTFDPSRRRLFRQGAVIASGAALGGLMLQVEAPAQGGKVSKAVAKYQDKPHGTQECDGCVQFIPGKTSSANGACKIVQGSISPKGWCMFFTPKS